MAASRSRSDCAMASFSPSAVSDWAGSAMSVPSSSSASRSSAPDRSTLASSRSVSVRRAVSSSCARFSSIAFSLAGEDVLAEPLPGAADAVLALDRRRVPEHLAGPVVGGEVALYLARPPGLELDRVVGHVGRRAAQLGQLADGGFHVRGG